MRNFIPASSGGIVFVLFPSGFWLYGVNDIVDARTDSLNPRKAVSCLVHAAPRTAPALKWQIVVVQCHS